MEPSTQCAASALLRSASSAARTDCLKSSRSQRDQLADLSVVGDHIVLESVDQRAGDAGGHRGDKAQPVGRQAWGQHRQAEQTEAAADQITVLAHQLLVAQDLGPAHVIGVAGGLRQRGDADQIVEQVVEGDGRGSGLYPARCDHHWQIVDQIPDHLIGGRTGSDDHPGADLGHRHRPLPQHVAGGGPRCQVLGFWLRRYQAAEIDDTTDADPGRERRRSSVPPRDRYPQTCARRPWSGPDKTPHRHRSMPRRGSRAAGRRPPPVRCPPSPWPRALPGGVRRRARASPLPASRGVRLVPI